MTDAEVDRILTEAIEEHPDAEIVEFLMLVLELHRKECERKRRLH